MNILFVPEGSGWLAIAKDCEYKDAICEEVIFAEITKDFGVLWQDRWDEAVANPSLEEAKVYILKNYKSHSGIIVGKRFQITSEE